MLCPAMQWDTAGNTVPVGLQTAPTFIMYNYTLEGGEGAGGCTLPSSYGVWSF